MLPEMFYISAAERRKSSSEFHPMPPEPRDSMENGVNDAKSQLYLARDAPHATRLRDELKSKRNGKYSSRELGGMIRWRQSTAWESIFLETIISSASRLILLTNFVAMKSYGTRTSWCRPVSEKIRLSSAIAPLSHSIKSSDVAASS